MPVQPRYLPTLNDIKRETARIREGWDEKTEYERSLGVTRGSVKQEPYTIPQYSFSQKRNGELIADRIAE